MTGQRQTSSHGGKRPLGLFALLALLLATHCALPAYRYEEDGGSGGEAGGDGSGGDSPGGEGNDGDGSGGDEPAAGGTATGGDGSSTGGTDNGTGGGSGGGPIVGDDCTQEGVFSCTTNASRNRLVCEGGELIAGTACGTNELCDTESDDGECKEVVAECLGRAAGVPFCEGPVRKVCGPDLVSVTSTTCDSVQHCTQSTTDVCAFCLDGEYECESDDLLLTCNEDNTDFDETECPDHNCSPTAGACTDSVCLVGQGHCEDDTLTICNAAQTAFEDPTPCDPGLCDEVNAQCDTCVAGSDPTCDDDGITVIDCSADGQTILTDECEDPKPFCQAGLCLACVVDTDCPSTDECHAGDCDVGGTYTCSEVPTSTGRCDLTSDDDGYCDGGACVECKDSGDCPAEGSATAETLCRDLTCVDPAHNVGNSTLLSGMWSRSPGNLFAYRLPPLDHQAHLDVFGVGTHTASAPMRMALYASDASGTSPVGSPVAQTAGVAFSTSSDNTKITVVNPSSLNVTLAPGTYWIAFEVQNAGTVLRNQANSAAACVAWAHTYGSSFGSAAPEGSCVSGDLSMYMGVTDLE